MGQGAKDTQNTSNTYEVVYNKTAQGEKRKRIFMSRNMRRQANGVVFAPDSRSFRRGIVPVVLKLQVSELLKLAHFQR